MAEAERKAQRLVAVAVELIPMSTWLPEGPEATKVTVIPLIVTVSFGAGCPEKVKVPEAWMPAPVVALVI